MGKIVCIYTIPEKNIASIVIEGERPKNLKIGSYIASENVTTPVVSIPFLDSWNGNINTEVFSVVADSKGLSVGDDVKII